MSAHEVRSLLELKPHPEGGAYRETFRDIEAGGPHKSGLRPHSSAIYYLLSARERSAWHRIDAVEIWHYYAGAPLELEIAPPGETLMKCVLGRDLAAGQRPQGIVPKSAWQSARTLGSWTLVGCTVAPAFEFDAFELAPSGWSPPVPPSL